MLAVGVAEALGEGTDLIERDETPILQLVILGFLDHMAERCSASFDQVMEQLSEIPSWQLSWLRTPTGWGLLSERVARGLELPAVSTPCPTVH